MRLELDAQFKEFRLSEALKTTYSLIWDDFCSWYLEWVKPGFEQPIDAEVYKRTVGFFEELMQILHPFMPFITEEIYQQLKKQEKDLTITPFNPAGQPDQLYIASGALLKEVITAIRDARNKSQLKPKDSIQLHIQTEQQGNYEAIASILAKQVNASAIHYTNTAVPNCINLVVQKDKFYLETEITMYTA